MPRRTSLSIPLLRICCVMGLGFHAWSLRAEGGAKTSCSELEQAVAAARESADTEQLRSALEQLGRAHYVAGEFPAALSVLDEAVRLPVAEDFVTLGRANLLLVRADAARLGADPSVAIAALSAAIAAFDQVGQEGAKGRVNARNLLASLYIFRLRAHLDEAEALLTQALVMAENELGPESASTASVLANLGKIQELRGENDRAEATMTRALVLMEQATGPDAPSTIICLRTLAYHYLQRGLHHLAEPLNVRVYETERRLRPGHPGQAAAASELGWLFHTLGDYVRAEALLREALAIREKTLGPDSLDTAVTLAHLGVLLDSTGRHAEAVPVLRRCLDIRQRVLPEESEAVAGAMSILGDALAETGALTEAEARLRRARRLRTALHGPDDLSVAYTCNALARTLAYAGETVAARREAAEAWRIASGADEVPAADRVEIAWMVAALAIIAADAPAARAAVAVAQQQQERLFAGTLGFTSESQRLALLRGFAPFDLPASAGQADAVARSVLRSKGIVLDSLLEDEALAHRQADPETARLLEQLRRARVSSLSTSAATTFQDSEQVEKALAVRVAAIGERRRALAMKTELVQAAIPVDAALVEFVRYQEIGPKLSLTPAYGALVLAPGAAPVWLKLGTEAELRPAVERLRLLAQSGGPPAWLEEAHGALMAPVIAALPPGTARLFLSPDGMLHTVPWAVLRAPDGRFLTERYVLAGVGSGRDLVPAAATASRPVRDLVVFAAPEFGRGLDPRSGKGMTTEPSLAMTRWRGLNLHDLPGARVEGETVGQLAREHGLSTEVYFGAQATEGRVRELRSPRLLHLATHGFVLPAAEGAGETSAMDQAGLALAGSRITIAAWLRGEQPAPANDGILTAREAASLDLRGTDLVVLSACETATGTAIMGEGVLGLRRGFARAGARNLLLTLWPVPDAETAALMRGFYERLLAGAPPADALAAEQVAALQRLVPTQGPVEAARIAGAFMLDVRR